MMGNVWLACCACDRYPELQREIELRDPRAKILRVGDGESLLRVIEAFARSGERMPSQRPARSAAEWEDPLW